MKRIRSTLFFFFIFLFVIPTSLIFAVPYHDLHTKEPEEKVWEEESKAHEETKVEAEIQISLEKDEEFQARLATDPGVTINAQGYLEKDFGRGHVMVYIPAGLFFMGSPRGTEGAFPDEYPQHPIFIDGFWFDKYEVTNKQFARFLKDKEQTNSDSIYNIFLVSSLLLIPILFFIGKGGKSGFRALSIFLFSTICFGLSCKPLAPVRPVIQLAEPDKGDHPVANVTWHDAVEYAQWAGMRLPTEAEWEYACRSGSTARFCFGRDVDLLDEYAWYAANSQGEAHPVGEKKPNSWGLHDLHCNVWEWCHDWYDAEYYSRSPKLNPKGSFRKYFRVQRGGSWSREANAARCAFRSGNGPNQRHNGSGFRCARTP